jgi:hypothetical protein
MKFKEYIYNIYNIIYFYIYILLQFDLRPEIAQVVARVIAPSWIRLLISVAHIEVGFGVHFGSGF